MTTSYSIPPGFEVQPMSVAPYGSHSRIAVDTKLYYRGVSHDLGGNKRVDSILAISPGHISNPQEYLKELGTNLTGDWFSSTTVPSDQWRQPRPDTWITNHIVVRPGFLGVHENPGIIVVMNDKTRSDASTLALFTLTHNGSEVDAMEVLHRVMAGSEHPKECVVM